jgi:hypothetical protein
MRILIKEQHKTKLILWLPSGPRVLNLILKYAKFEGKKVSPEQRKNLIQQIKVLRKIHRPLVLIDIKQKNGDSVFIKI